MFKKRIVNILIAFCIVFSLITLRIFALSNKTEYREAVNAQSQKKVVLYNNRGFIYDYHFLPIVNNNELYSYIIDPIDVKLTDIKDSNLHIDEKIVAKHYYYNTPFIITSPLKYDVSGKILREKVFKRYSVSGIASHIIGYSIDDVGMTGLEKEFNNLLSNHRFFSSIIYEKNAVGGKKANSEGYTVDKSDDLTGVVTTLDYKIQEICEIAFEKSFTKGAVVVTDCKTGEIRALASFPNFDPNNISISINDKNSPLINRALASYDFGSIFKIIVTASALESGITPDFSFDCKGYYEFETQKIECFKTTGHGHMTMDKAFEQSCNPYFISLAKQVGAEKILETAKKFKLGSYCELFKGYTDSGGNLPSLGSLQDEVSLANFSIGQGNLLVTPVQAAGVVNVIANGGYYVSPSLIKGISDKQGRCVEQPTNKAEPIRIISESTAKTIEGFMERVVSQGSGFNARSSLFKSGGKTGSAETGWQINGTEKMIQGWFSGFFPAESATPQYSIAILCENGKSGAYSAAPIFKTITEEIFKRGLLN